MEEKVTLCWLVQSLHYHVHRIWKHDIFPNRRNLRENTTFGGRGTQLFKMTVFKQVEVVSVDTSLI